MGRRDLSKRAGKSIGKSPNPPLRSELSADPRLPRRLVSVCVYMASRALSGLPRVRVQMCWGAGSPRIVSGGARWGESPLAWAGDLAALRAREPAREPCCPGSRPATRNTRAREPLSGGLEELGSTWGRRERTSLRLGGVRLSAPGFCRARRPGWQLTGAGAVRSARLEPG